MYRHKIRSRTFLISLVFLIALSFFFSPAAIAANDAPNGVHLTWSLDEVHSTINVTWGTNSAGSGNIVYYDDESRDGNPGEYEYKAEGYQKKLSGKNARQ